ncbi:ComF family protein [Paenirhodobacter sp.]|uniref:ComF family protein n=1 Tax=Paenirhodobacter sp. TaxID=1965326 RepID=UPI003B3FC288
MIGEDRALWRRAPEVLNLVATQTLHVLFPPRCIGCGAPVGTDFGLCGECWRETGFITGLACDCCGAPLPGEDDSAICDECLHTPRPWKRGRAAIRYAGTGRKLVLAFKHGDRLDLARPLGEWLARAVAPIIEEGMVVAPVPLHRLRLLKRRYNQSALLARQIGRSARIPHIPDLFERIRATPSQEGKDREERFANLSGALRVNPRRVPEILGRPVLIVDDVLTSGATLAAATEAALAAGASHVHVAALARVSRDV